MRDSISVRSRCVRFSSVLTTLLCLAAHTWGAQVLFTAPGTSVTLGHPYGDLEFNNPLTGTETVAGFRVLEWRDAGYVCPPLSFEDWSVSNPCPADCSTPGGCIDGYANEIWLRDPGDMASTATTVASTVVSVHFHGDNSDGIVEVFVDGVVVATIDMWTSATDNVFVLVSGLPNATHIIDLVDAGPTQQPGAFGDDIAIMGAAALQQFDPFWKAGHVNYAPSGMPDFDQRQNRWAHEIRCGLNAVSDSVAMGDDVQLIPPSVLCPSANSVAVTKGLNGVMETPTGFDDFYIYEYCGPTAVADCLWWFDSKFEQDDSAPPCDGADTYDLVTAYPAATDDHCPDNVDTTGPGQIELIEDLAMRMDTGGQSSGTIRHGTTAADMLDAVRGYLADKGLHDDYLVRLIREPDYPFLVTELERSQDLILGLTFVQDCQGPVFIGGHAVTMSGFELPSQNLCLSDPYYDLAEAGVPGRVLPPVPHPHGIPETLHNDAAYVSHDCFATIQAPLPAYGVTRLIDYATTGEGTDCNDIANFHGQNGWYPDEPEFREPVPCDPACPVETFISFVLEISPFDWKRRLLVDYAPNGVPDFDQRQGGLICLIDQSWSFCGPTAVANSLWWFDSVREANPIPPPNVNSTYPLIPIPTPTVDDHDPSTVVPLIDDLGFNWLNTNGMTGGFPPRPPFCGTYIEDMEQGIKNYLVNVGLDADYYVHRVRAPSFDWVAREIERSQDVILLLGFWQLQENGGPTWVRIGGHYVTSAGIDREGRLIAISDPFLDTAETTPLGGVVGNGTLEPHVHPAMPPDGTHNDAGNISHDIFAAVATNSPGGVWGPEGYAAAIGPFLDNFEGQNTSDEIGDVPTGPPQGPEPIQTEVDYALAVSPCPWVFDQIVARGYCSGDPALACLVDADCPAADAPCLNAVFQWPIPLAYEYVSGSFMTPADIGTYSWTVFAANVGNSSLQPPPDPPAGTGTWYLFRAAHCGTWQTAPGEEPERDQALP